MKFIFNTFVAVFLLNLKTQFFKYFFLDVCLCKCCSINFFLLFMQKKIQRFVATEVFFDSLIACPPPSSPSSPSTASHLSKSSFGLPSRITELLDKCEAVEGEEGEEGGGEEARFFEITQTNFKIIFLKGPSFF